MRELKIFNSLGMKKETFTPLVPGKVSIYCCGPTVYNDPHVGNFRPVVTFDVLRRLLIHLGYEVKFVSNYTDVDDKAQDKDISVSWTDNSANIAAFYNGTSSDIVINGSTVAKQ